MARTRLGGGKTRSGRWIAAKVEMAITAHPLAVLGSGESVYSPQKT